MRILRSARVFISVIVCVLFPVALFAHPGHGPEGTLLHDVVHAAWIATIVVVIALPLQKWWKAGADKNKR